uniref:Uncharacterized protein n=1 Tax=Picea glauca TaxID=3330 RepID=A0A101M438_PICGL|nr:hypothetical protein ABT39_MTgene593 [Picea glauca]
MRLLNLATRNGLTNLQCFHRCILPDCLLTWLAYFLPGCP